MQSFVPKNRRPKFDLFLRIHDLNNVPLVSGTSFIKWHLPSSTAAEHRGGTNKCTIKDHKVNYEYEKSLPVRLVVGKDQMLQETWIEFEILQEYSSGGRGERITLGNIKLNLAEYVDTNQSGQPAGITRRYLMQESKINSTLKIEIAMTHVEGDRNYDAPQLRTAPVFGGIAGIMSQEAQDVSDDVGHMPSLSTKSREHGELQDMYRRTLAASWAAQPGELKADECIEDIFAGGDGWGSHLHKAAEKNPQSTSNHGQLRVSDNHDGASDDEISSRNASSTNLSLLFSKKNKWSPKTKSRTGHSNGTGGEDHHRRDVLGPTLGQHTAISGRASLQAQVQKMERTTKEKPRRHRHEIDEFENPYRDNLRSWKLQQVASG